MGNILYQQQENRHVKQEEWQSYSVSIVVLGRVSIQYVCVQDEKKTGRGKNTKWISSSQDLRVLSFFCGQKPVLACQILQSSSEVNWANIREE